MTSRPEELTVALLPPYGQMSKQTNLAVQGKERRTTMSSEPHRIDVHHHILPPEYLTALAGVGVTNVGRVTFPQWSVETTLAVMDRQGIATALTSISAPGIYFGDRAFARDLARRCNEISARLVSDHPRRFGVFAVVPLPDVEAALREVEYALDTLKCDGGSCCWPVSVTSTREIPSLMPCMPNSIAEKPWSSFTRTCRRAIPCPSSRCRLRWWTSSLTPHER